MNADAPTRDMAPVRHLFVHGRLAGNPSLVSARPGLRLARYVAFTAALLLFVALPQAASASLSWSGPITIDITNLSGVACPSISQCTAVGSGGRQVTFDPTSPGTPTPTTIDSTNLSGVACPSISQCTAIDTAVGGDGQQVTFDPAAPGTPTPTTIDSSSGYGLSGVACPSVSQCTAVGYDGREVTFDPTSPGTPTPTTIDSTNLDGVACPSTSQCTAVDSGGRQVTFDPTSPGTPTPTTIDGTEVLDGVACPSISQCTAVDQEGQQVTFDPASPGAPTPTTIDIIYLNAVACPSTSQCTAVDGDGQQVTFDPTSPGKPTPTTIDNTNYLSAVACPSVGLCIAVDEFGDGFVGQGSAVADPTSTSVACSPSSVVVGSAASCTATVTDTAPSGATTPSGSVSFTASPTSGSFGSSGSCTLATTGMTGVASCQVMFTPSETGSYAVAGAYGGDSTHHTSSGQSALVTVTVQSSPPQVPGSAAVRRVTVSGTTASVAVSCSGGSSCTITLTLLVVETLHHGKVTAVAASAKTVRKTVLVGYKTVTVAAGKSETVKLSLNGSGKRLLAKHTPLRTKLTVRALGKTVASSAIAFKAKKKT